MNMALGRWIAMVANQRIDQYGETPAQALTWVQEWVDVYQGAYRALGAPYGDDDDDLLRWLNERTPLPPETATEQAAQKPPATAGQGPSA
jgi:hypothetical protein